MPSNVGAWQHIQPGVQGVRKIMVSEDERGWNDGNPTPSASSHIHDGGTCTKDHPCLMRGSSDESNDHHNPCLSWRVLSAMAQA